MTATSSAAARDLRKVYPGGTVALHGVSVEIGAGEIVGLLGMNGSGKSTLVKILSGVERPTAGVVEVAGTATAGFADAAAANAAGIGVVHQELPLFSGLTAAENLVAGLESGQPLGPRRKREARAAYEEVASRLVGAPPADALIADLALDQRQLVAISRAISRGAHTIVLDEPTSALLPSERDSLHRALLALRDQGLGILYVSHFVDDILAVSARVLVLRDGQLQLEAKAPEVGRRTVIESIVGEPLEAAARPAAHRRSRTSTGGGLRCRALAGAGFGPLDLSVERGEIVGIYGLVGSGTTETLEAIYGLRGSRGKAFLDGKEIAGPPPARLAQGVAFATGDRKKGVVSEWSMADNVDLPELATRSAFSWHRPGDAASGAEKVRDGLGIKGEPSAPMSSLSGGNQQKVVLGRWLAARKPRCLLLDEPTRGIDVKGRQTIHERLRELAGTAVLLYSSDPEELTRVCERAVVLSRGRVVSELAGTEISVAALEAAAHAGASAGAPA